MSSSQNNYNYIGANFVIENNVLKGASKEIDLSVNIGEAILRHLSDSPKHVAQIDAETKEKTTYEEMRVNMIRCALWLQKQGVSRGDVITVCTHNHLDAYIPCFAIFLVGAIYNPWHHEVTISNARHFMKLTKPKVIFVCESAIKTLMEAARLENINTIFTVFGKDGEKNSLTDIMRLQTTEEVERFTPKLVKGSDDIALILFSSGSTGLPKGVVHSYDTLTRMFYGNPLMPTNRLVVLWYSSLYWISGTLLMVQSLINSGTRIIHSDCEPKQTSEVIEKFKVNSFLLPPVMLTHFCKSNVFHDYSYKSMKAILTGGTKLSHECLQDLKNNLPDAFVSQGYGMTETGGLVTIQTSESKRVGSIGFVAANVQVKIVDADTGKPLGPNEYGECIVKIPTAMVGYYKNLEATKSTVDDDGWIHSGDQVYYTEEGEVMFVDRLKEVMKFRGHHVSPSELEEILLKHPAVIAAAVVPKPHEFDIERPMAFVKKAPGINVTEEELVELTAELGEFKKLWGGVKFIEDMPLTASGKINRKDLRDMAKALSNCKT